MRWVVLLILGFGFTPFLANAQALGGGMVSSSQCINSNAQPAAFISTTPGSGGLGPLTYQWEKSTDISFPGGLGANDIGGATGLGYTEPGTLNIVTYYRRRASDGLQFEWSNIITVGMNPTFTPIVPPLPIICQGVTSFPVNYTTTNFPDQYNIIWNAAASAAGFADVNPSLSSNNLLAFNGSFTVNVPSNVAAATYNGTLVVRVSSTGCASTPSGSAVLINPLPTASVSGTTAVCENGTSPVVTFTGSNATAPYTFTYKINGGANQTVATSSGNSVTVSVPTGTPGPFVYSLVSVQESSSTHCTNTASGTATVAINPLPTATIGGTTSVCQNAASQSITFTGSNGTAPYTFTYKINGGTNQTATTSSGNSVTISVPAATAGTFVYSLLSVQESGPTTCSNTASGAATITVNPLPAATISATTAVCQNATPPLITFTGSNGTAPYTFTYTINGGTSQTVTTTSGNSVTVAAPTGITGTFIYSLLSVQENSTTSCSNPASGTATITVKALPAATISGTTIVCQNAGTPSVAFTGSNGAAPYTFTYKINGGANQTVTTSTGNSVTVTAPTGTAGTFTYTLVSIQEGSATTCSNTSSGTAIITVKSLPTATISGTTAVCQNATVPLMAFTGSNGTAPYTFTYKINGGTNQVATTSLGNAVTVPVPTGTTGSFVYALVSVLESSGTACANTASGTATVTVNTLPVVAAIAGASTVCLNNTTTLTNPTPTGTWSSSNNTIATVNAGGLVTGVSLGAVTIAYTVTNSNGCVNSSAATMNVAAIPAIPTVTASGPLVFCVGSTVVLTSSSGNGNQWYRDGVLLTAQTNQTYTAAASGNYTVQVTNGNGCVSNSPSLATTVTVNPLPAATIRGTTAVCQNAATPLITFTGSNATAPYTFTYKINGGANQTITTVSGNSVTLPAPTGTAGTFIYTLESVKEGSATACSNTATGSATVTVNPLPTATISGTIAVCQNAAAPLITFTGSNATAPYTFTYTINGGANQNIITTTDNSANVTALTGVAGVFAYTLVSVKEAGATACSIAVNATATVVVNPLPTGIIQTPAASYICAGIPQILTASTADNYQWYLDQNIINGATAASYPATVAGNYSVQLISKDGCVNNATNSVQLILYLKPVLSFIPDKQCLNSPVTFLNRSSFASSGNIDWQWDLGDGNGSSLFSPSHIYGAEGMYTVSLTANNLSCPNLTEKNTAAYFIESPIPGIRYAVITAVVNKPVTLTARPFGAKYLWQPFNSLSNYTVQSPVATLATQQEYTVEIISAEGCVTVDTVLVNLFPGSEIYAPQGFTPNGDGQNDSFYPILVRANKLNYFKVFNRWGNLLFQTNDATPANGWNGKYNGTDQPAGTYTWIAEAVDADGNIIKRSGNVLLLR